MPQGIHSRCHLYKDILQCSLTYVTPGISFGDFSWCTELELKNRLGPVWSNRAVKSKLRLGPGLHQTEALGLGWDRVTVWLGLELGLNGGHSTLIITVTQP